jgi:hypothetical protein
MDEPVAEIHFRMVNGDTHVLTTPPGHDPDEAFRNVRDDPTSWIKVDDGVYIARANIVSMRFLHEFAGAG